MIYRDYRRQIDRYRDKNVDQTFFRLAKLFLLQILKSLDFWCVLLHTALVILSIVLSYCTLYPQTCSYYVTISLYSLT